jgi:F1F0 ATPase subunit 2
MSEVLVLLLCGLGGIMLGAIFFGGLWWTVQKGLGSPRAALWFLGSLLVRTALVLVGFYLISRGDWRNVVACLVGFVIGRVGVTLLVRKKEGKPCA